MNEPLMSQDPVVREIESENLGAQPIAILDSSLQRCFKRLDKWRTPSNWSPSGWLQELKAHAVAAAYEAQTAFDPQRGVPFGGFIYLRVMARVLTHWRREWAYAHQCIPESDGEGGDASATCLPSPVSHEDLRDALESLPASRRWVVEQLFWKGRTEANVGLQLGITQRAVSKRRQAAVHCLREALR
jgi:DNA-directed RNA polymerase specialized sigma24 family protein